MPEVIAPAAPAAPASPAPAAPAPAAAAPSPAPVSSPAPAAAQPAPQDPGRELSIEEKIHVGWEKAKAAVPVTEEAPDAAVEAGAPAQAEPAVPVEGEPTAGEQTPEQIAAAAKAAEEEAAGTVEDTEPIDIGESLAPKDFADKIKGTEAEKFFNANPDVRDLVYGALRRDTDNREIRSIVPDAATARSAVASATRWNKFDSGFLDATTPDGAQSFLSGLIHMAIEYDDKGEPILDAGGGYKFHPALPTILNTVGDKRVSVLRESIQKSAKIEGQARDLFLDGLKALETQAGALTGDDADRLHAALDIIRGVVPAAPQPQDEPQDIKDTRAALKAKEDALTRQGSEQREAEIQQAIDRAGRAAFARIDGQLKPLFSKSGLQGTVLEKARAEVGARLDAELEKNGYYQTLYDGIEHRLKAETDSAKREAIEKELMAHELLYSQPIIGPIAAKVIKEFTNPALKTQSDKETKVAGQVHASRTDARGGAVTTSPGKVMTPAALREQITTEYRAKHGADAELPEGYLIREMQKRSGVFKQPA